MITQAYAEQAHPPSVHPKAIEAGALAADLQRFLTEAPGRVRQQLYFNVLTGSAAQALNPNGGGIPGETRQQREARIQSAAMEVADAQHELDTIEAARTIAALGELGLYPYLIFDTPHGPQRHQLHLLGPGGAELNFEFVAGIFDPRTQGIQRLPLGEVNPLTIQLYPNPELLGAPAQHLPVTT